MHRVRSNRGAAEPSSKERAPSTGQARSHSRQPVQRDGSCKTVDAAANRYGALMGFLSGRSACRQGGVRKPWAKGCRSSLQRNPLLAAENRSFSSSRGYEIPVMQLPAFRCLHAASSATCGNMLCPDVPRTNSYGDEKLLFSIIFGPARCRGQELPGSCNG